MKNFLTEHEGIIVAAFCSPSYVQTENAPNAMTEENYRALKAAGVDLLMGHNEIFSSSMEKYAFDSLALCEKTGLKYLAFDELHEAFYSIGHERCPWVKRKLWTENSPEEKEEILNAYEKSLSRYMQSKTCVGVKFYDEIGLICLDGIAEAKKRFDANYPDKLFFINQLGYNVEDWGYVYGIQGSCLPKEEQDAVHLPEMPELTTDYKVKLKRWGIFVDKVLDRLDLPILTQDTYPMMTFCSELNTVHRALYDMSSYLATVKKRRGIPVGNFIQDGRWEDTDRGEMLTRAEFDLQVNVLVAYGMDMILLYTGCCPTECRNSIGNVGLIDKHGKFSPSYDYMRSINRQLRAVDKDLRSAEFIGMMAAGEFKSLQSKDLSNVTFNDAIYVGELPGETLITSFGGIRSVEATSQCIIGCFETETEKMCYIVNNSINFGANCFVTLDESKEVTQIYEGVAKTSVKEKINIYNLPAGESVFIKFAK